MAWQGAVLRKDHGGSDTRARCEGEHANTLRHAILAEALDAPSSFTGRPAAASSNRTLSGKPPERHWAPCRHRRVRGTGKERWPLEGGGLQAPEGPFPADKSLEISGLEVVGTLKGVMQVGSTVARARLRPSVKWPGGPQVSSRPALRTKQP